MESGIKYVKRFLMGKSFDFLDELNLAVMDTLGWICYLKGSYLNAMAEREDSVALTPENPIINYHMGMVY